MRNTLCLNKRRNSDITINRNLRQSNGDYYAEICIYEKGGRKEGYRKDVIIKMEKKEELGREK